MSPSFADRTTTAAQSNAQDYFDLLSTTESDNINSLADELEVQADDEPAAAQTAYDTPACDHPKPSSSLSMKSLTGTFHTDMNFAADPAEGCMFLYMRILDGKRICKSGKILDYEGRVLGELSDVELDKCVGAYVNEMGHVYNKHGEHVGYARILAGGGSCDALKELMEGLQMLEMDQKSGKVVNSSGDVMPCPSQMQGLDEPLRPETLLSKKALRCLEIAEIATPTVPEPSDLRRYSVRRNGLYMVKRSGGLEDKFNNVVGTLRKINEILPSYMSPTMYKNLHLDVLAEELNTH